MPAKQCAADAIVVAEMSEPEHRVDLLMTKSTCQGASAEVIGAPPTTRGAAPGTLAEAAPTGVRPSATAAPISSTPIRRPH